MVGAGALQLVSLLREALNRVLGLPELAASLAGLRPPKKLRLRVVILRDGDGTPVAAKDDVQAVIAETRDVLAREAGTDIVPVDGRLIETLAEPAADVALDSPCTDQGLWRTDLGAAGAWFRPRTLRGGLPLIGRGAPLTVFVVRDVVGKCGCSLGPLGDYVTIDGHGLATARILAHEVAHSCGLRHSGRDDNLMRPRGPGRRMTRWQRAVFRSSRHVTYL